MIGVFFTKVCFTNAIQRKNCFIIIPPTLILATDAVCTFRWMARGPCPQKAFFFNVYRLSFASWSRMKNYRSTQYPSENYESISKLTHVVVSISAQVRVAVSEEARDWYVAHTNRVSQFRASRLHHGKRQLRVLRHRWAWPQQHVHHVPALPRRDEVSKNLDVSIFSHIQLFWVRIIF